MIIVRASRYIIARYPCLLLIEMQWLILEDFGCGFFSILAGVLKAAPPPQLFMLNTEGRLTSGEWCLKAERVDHITIAWCEMGKVGASKLIFGQLWKRIVIIPDGWAVEL